nr:MAG: MC141R [Molluscum contagiosum virus]
MSTALGENGKDGEASSPCSSTPASTPASTPSGTPTMTAPAFYYSIDSERGTYGGYAQAAYYAPTQLMPAPYAGAPSHAPAPAHAPAHSASVASLSVQSAALPTNAHAHIDWVSCVNVVMQRMHQSSNFFPEIDVHGTNGRFLCTMVHETVRLTSGIHCSVKAAKNEVCHLLMNRLTGVPNPSHQECPCSMAETHAYYEKLHHKKQDHVRSVQAVSHSANLIERKYFSTRGFGRGHGSAPGGSGRVCGPSAFPERFPPPPGDHSHLKPRRGAPRGTPRGSWRGAATGSSPGGAPGGAACGLTPIPDGISPPCLNGTTMRGRGGRGRRARGVACPGPNSSMPRMLLRPVSVPVSSE